MNVVAGERPHPFATPDSFPNVPQNDTSSIDVTEESSVDRKSSLFHHPFSLKTDSPSSTTPRRNNLTSRYSVDWLAARMKHSSSQSAGDAFYSQSAVTTTKPMIIPPDVLNFTLIPPVTERGTCKDCVIFHKGKKMPYSEKLLLEKDPNPVSFTLVATATFDRISFIPFFLERWHAYMSISIQCKVNEVNQVEREIKKFSLPDRVVIILLTVGRMNDKFYVNRLRNLAITAIRTTHFLTLDMDMWPTANLHDELLKLPTDILQSNSTAIIVPAMFLRPELVLPNCTTTMECVLKSNELFPSTKDELQKCLKMNRCTTTKNKGEQHRYTNSQWISATQPYLKMNCFISRLQEPYLVLKYSPEMDLFDERFINYGCNKVQYVDLLRLKGFDFYLLTQAFAMDIVHHDSKYRRFYLIYARAAKASPMRKLCDRFMMKAELTYPSSAKVNICNSLYVME